MRSIGFSTGSLARSDFRGALALLAGTSADAIELSAFGQGELEPLVSSVDSLDLSRFHHISVHAPGKFPPSDEPKIAELLTAFMTRGWPVIIHPNSMYDIARWQVFGNLLCIENMDKRKPLGRTVEELQRLFDRLPDASLCLDLGHARQFDSSMTEAYRILRAFGSRLRQLHVSEVNTQSKHARVSPGAADDFREVAHLIPNHVPVILETPVTHAEVEDEISRARESLEVPAPPIAA